MAKIIIVVPSEEDISEAVKALKKDKHEVITVAPSPANFLHLCLGMLPDDPNDGITDAEDDKSEDEEDDKSENDKPSKEDKKDKEDKSEDDKSEVEDEDEITAECLIFGAKVKAILTENAESYLKCKTFFTHHSSETADSLRAHYLVEQTEVSFWKNAQDKVLRDNMLLAVNTHETIINVPIVEAENDETIFYVGKDYLELFHKK